MDGNVCDNKQYQTMPAGFLKEEEKCGHLVTAETKKLWAVQLGCLEEIRKICERHAIPYFASGGTLLGAVRHHGYIPWDDDIDVMMFYDDYLRFCEIAPIEIQHPYFFQNYKTEPDFGPALSRVRNSESTGCTFYDMNMANGIYNCGIFVDVFPLCGIEDNWWRRVRQKTNLHFWRCIVSGNIMKRWAQRGTIKQKIYKWLHPYVWMWNIASLFIDSEGVSDKVMKVCGSAKEYRKVGLLSFKGFYDKMIWEKKWFDELMTLPFENTSIPCPKEYDPILRTQYGDYMKFVKGGQIHTMVLFDTDTPYREKINNVQQREHELI